MHALSIDVLLIEDNIHDAIFVRHAMKDAGLNLRLHHLMNGDDAVNYLLGADSSKAMPRMILSDIRMPKVDGLDFLRQIKGDLKTKNIPVIMMSSSDMQEDIDRSYALGADSYMVKSMDVQSFMASVTEIFRSWLPVAA